MSDSDYSELVVEHFDRPRNVGRIAPGPDVISGSAGRREQGVEFALTAKVANGAIAEARFEAYACPHCLAAGSLLTEMLIGMDQPTLSKWSWRSLADTLKIPTEKRGRLLILEDAIRAMAEDWRRRF